MGSVGGECIITDGLVEAQLLQVLLDVCMAPGKFSRMAITKSMSHGAGYRFARKIMWGDLWRYPLRIARTVAREYVSSEAREQLNRLALVARRALKQQDPEGSGKIARSRRLDAAWHYMVLRNRIPLP